MDVLRAGANSDVPITIELTRAGLESAKSIKVLARAIVYPSQLLSQTP